MMSEPPNPEAVSHGYRAVRGAGAGLIDLAGRGRFMISGSEAVMFLNGMITNDIKNLAVNSWMPAVFPNVQGRLLAVVRVLNLGGEFLIDTEAATHSTVLNLLSRFTMAGDFRVTDVSDQISSLSVQGRDVENIVGSIIGSGAPTVDRRTLTAADFNGARVTLIRATHTAEDGFDFFIEHEKADGLRSALIDAGAEAISSGVLEVLRIEAGIPRYGIDLDETTVVNEAGFEDAISYNKGCYVGQEIIVRIKHRGHVAKKLGGVVLGHDLAVEKDTKVLSLDGHDAGRITSSAFSPSLDRRIALGYLKYDYLAAGTQLKIPVGDHSVPAKVVELPFVRGSWYE